MSEKPHCARERNGCKMLELDWLSRLIKEINEFLRILVIILKESIGQDLGCREVRVWPGKTARKMQENVAGCTIGGCRCIQ